MAQQITPEVLDTLTRRMAAYDPYARREASEFEKQMMMLQAADKIGSRTQQGFALGNLINGLFQAWANRYKARDDFNKSLLAIEDEKTLAEQLEKLRLENPEQFKRSTAFLTKHGRAIPQLSDQTAPATAQSTQTPDLSGINRDFSRPRLLSKAGSALDQAVAAESANQPTVDTPFTAPDYNFKNNLDTQEKILDKLADPEGKRSEFYNAMKLARGGLGYGGGW